MSILYIRDANGNFVPVPAIKGQDGKDAPADVVRYGAQALTDDQKAQARENIGAAELEGEFELIESIAFDGDQGVTSIERNVEPGGLPYRFDKLWVEIYTACPDGTNRKISSYIYGSRNPSIPLNYAMREYPSGVYRISALGVLVVHGMWFPLARSVSSFGSQGTLSTDWRALDTYLKGDDHVVRLKITVGDGLDFPADTVINIWGVRENA